MHISTEDLIELKYVSLTNIKIYFKIKIKIKHSNQQA